MTGDGLSFFTQIDTLFSFSEEFQIGVSDSRHDISTNSERIWNIYIIKLEC